MNTPAFDFSVCFAERARRMKASEIRELLKLLAESDIISFAGGIPDPALFPAEAMAEAFCEVVADPALQAEALQYSVSEGYLPLRQWISGHMASLGVLCEAENILITNGSQQALDFLGRLFLSPGDTALVTAPTYLGALQAFNAYEPRYETLDLSGGHKVSGRVKFAYVVPDFSNPTGATMPLCEREALLSLGKELEIPVIEDGAYTALRYDGEDLPSLLALEQREVGDINATRTIYCGTFSKTIAPGLRVGWICAARALIDKLVLIKQASDLHSATMNQMVMWKVAKATFAKQLPRLREVYRERRNVMLGALETHMPKGVSWQRPEGGMFIWLTLPEGTDAKALLARSIEDARVAFVPGGAFFAASGGGTNTARLSFSASSSEAIIKGIARLGHILSAS